MQDGCLKIILCRWSLIEKKKCNNRSDDLILIRHRARVRAAPGGLLVCKGSVPLRRATCGGWVIKSTGGCAGLPWGAGRGAVGRQVPCTWGHTAHPSGKPCCCWRCPRPSDGVDECSCSPQGWLGDFLPSTSLFWCGGFWRGLGGAVAVFGRGSSPSVSPETPQEPCWSGRAGAAGLGGC